MNEAKLLIIGKDSYNPSNKNYTNLKIDDYPTDNVAFFPCRKEETYNLYNLTTYRRILGFIKNEKLTEIEFNKLPTPKTIANQFMKKGVYFINALEFDLKGYTIQSKNKKNKLIFDSSTIILCFGTDAIDKFKNYENVHQFPHPSPLNNNKFWEKYDNEYSSKDYNFDYIFEQIYLPSTLK
ncbi:hypothetical protein CD117_03015 [Mammaliicoccus sciuri]|uniref:Uncharacterized protein n=1 Tax=Mammaliicoccus sciuri TaxID=1296 RepID=A0AAJ4SJ59_MAMSC|nr:hypothetical protein [Mammaliicoccus sciuri]RTX74392.1 hypothetical protein CD117_03015 [Mammaliicoccus sciuri]